MADFYVSPYVDNLALPNYRTQSYETQLEVQLLSKRQQDYNTVLSRLSNLQSSALNVSMLNLKGKQKLDQYNNELNEMLSQDLGDLTDTQVQAQVANYFNKISNDTDLKQRSKLSQHYQGQLDNIERMRNSKDPTKSGYNSVNETVFRKWTGGLEDFQLADDISGFDRRMQSYVPYKDIDQKLVNLTKLLHAEELTTLGPSGSNGYTLLESTKGVSKERIRNLLQSTLDQDELSQMEVLSKYRIIQQGTPEGLNHLYDTYTGWIQKENQYTKNELAKAKAYIEQFNPKNLDPKLSKEDRAKKELEYTALQQSYQEKEAELTKHLASQTVNTMSREEWLKKSPDELLPYVNQLTTESYINGISDSLAWKDQVQKIGTDEAYFANRRLNLMEERLNWDKQMGAAKIALEQEKLKAVKAKGEKETESHYTNPTDIFKSPETIIDSWDKVTQLTKEYQNRTAPVITSQDSNGNSLIDPKNLIDDSWLKEHQGNYEVQLWNAYVGKFHDTAFTDQNKKNPNLNGFRAFKAQVENGDYKNDPVIQGIGRTYKRDKQLSDWFNETTTEVANTINNQTRLEDVSNGEHSLGDYARQHGWNGKGEMIFGIRDGQGYKTMTWSEIRKQYNEVMNTGILSKGAERPLKDIPILQDPNFFKLVAKGVEQENKHSKMIQDVYANKMPQIFQGKQMEALDDKTRTLSIAAINSSIKGSASSVQPSINAEQVTNVSIPYGIGEYGGFSITEKEAERLDALGAKIVTVGGEELSPKANVWYKVPMQPVDGYDLMFNEMFEKKGIVEDNINGRKVTITNIKNNDNQYYVNIEGLGQQAVNKKDINAIFAEVGIMLDMLDKSTQKPK